MEITIKIFRYDPEKDERGHYETYVVEGDENDRVLDVLELVKGHKDGSLAFRRSCAHGVCGSGRQRPGGVVAAGARGVGDGRRHHARRDVLQRRRLAHGDADPLTVTGRAT